MIKDVKFKLACFFLVLGFGIFACVNIMRCDVVGIIIGFIGVIGIASIRIIYFLKNGS